MHIFAHLLSFFTMLYPPLCAYCENFFFCWIPRRFHHAIIKWLVCPAEYKFKTMGLVVPSAFLMVLWILCRQLDQKITLPNHIDFKIQFRNTLTTKMASNDNTLFYQKTFLRKNYPKKSYYHLNIVNIH